MARFVFYIIIFSSVIVLDSHAQSSEQDIGLPNNIIIDLEKNTVSENYPFDEYFKIIIKSKEALGDSLTIRGAKYRKNKIRQKPFRGSFNQIFKSKKDSIRIQLDKIDSLTYQAEIPPLLPNKLYELLFLKKTNNSQTIIYEKLLEYIADNKKPEAINLIKTKIIPWFLLSKRENFDAPSENDIYSFFNDSSLHFNETVLTLSYTALSASVISDVMSKLNLKGIKAKEMAQFFQMSINTDPDPSTPSNMIISPDQILEGIITYNGSENDKFEWNKRVANYKKTLAVLKKATSQIEELLAYYPTNPNILHSHKSLIGITKSLTDNLEKVNTHRTSFQTKINKNFAYPFAVRNTSRTPNEKENKVTYLVSDFGFTNSWGKDQFGETEYIGRPHFGLNWHVGGYNKNKRISQVANKRVWHQFSLAVGVTLGEVNEGGYTDLFSNLSPTAGINYRLTQDVRLGVGLIALKKDRNPIIDREGLALLPYFSLSFDYSLFKDLIIASRIFN